MGNSWNWSYSIFESLSIEYKLHPYPHTSEFQESMENGQCVMDLLYHVRIEFPELGRTDSEMFNIPE